MNIASPNYRACYATESSTENYVKLEFLCEVIRHTAVS